MLIPSIRNQGLDPAELIDQRAKINFTGQKGMEVKPWKGIWSAGQGVGAIDAVRPMADAVARLRREYDAARQR